MSKDAQHLTTLRKYYDIPTLKMWIKEYQNVGGKRQREQVARWRRTLETLKRNQ